MVNQRYKESGKFPVADEISDKDKPNVEELDIGLARGGLLSSFVSSASLENQSVSSDECGSSEEMPYMAKNRYEELGDYPLAVEISEQEEPTVKELDISLARGDLLSSSVLSVALEDHSISAAECSSSEEMPDMAKNGYEELGDHPLAVETSEQEEPNVEELDISVARGNLSSSSISSVSLEDQCVSAAECSSSEETIHMEKQGYEAPGEYAMAVKISEYVEQNIKEQALNFREILEGQRTVNWHHMTTRDLKHAVRLYQTSWSLHLPGTIALDNAAMKFQQTIFEKYFKGDTDV